MAPRAEPDAPFVVEAENASAIRLLIAMQTQWRTQPLSTWSSARLVRTGLDYSVIDFTARSRAIDLTPEDFLRLQCAEAECLTAWSEEAGK